MKRELVGYTTTLDGYPLSGYIRWRLRPQLRWVADIKINMVSIA